MSGRPKQKVYVYNFDGSVYKNYNCLNDLRKEFYPEAKGIIPLFKRHNSLKKENVIKDYVILPNDKIAFLQRVGRIIVRDTVKKYKSELLILSRPFPKDREVKAFNLNHELIATFKNVRIASKLLNIEPSIIHTQVNKPRKRFNGVDEIYFTN